jgi:hypothetical protein
VARSASSHRGAGARGDDGCGGFSLAAWCCWCKCGDCRGGRQAREQGTAC